MTIKTFYLGIGYHTTSQQILQLLTVHSARIFTQCSRYSRGL